MRVNSHDTARRPTAADQRQPARRARCHTSGIINNGKRPVLYLVVMDNPSSRPILIYNRQRSSPRRARSINQMNTDESKMNRLSSLSMAEVNKKRGVKASRAVTARARVGGERLKVDRKNFV